MNWSKITGIEPIGPAPSVCISVDAPDRLYALGSGILTHNTAGDPRDPLPPAYFDRDGKLKYLSTTPEEDHDIAALLAPELARPLPDTERIFAQASPERRAAANRWVSSYLADPGSILRSQRTTAPLFTAKSFTESLPINIQGGKAQLLAGGVYNRIIHALATHSAKVADLFLGTGAVSSYIVKSGLKKQGNVAVEFDPVRWNYFKRIADPKTRGSVKRTAKAAIKMLERTQSEAMAAVKNSESAEDTASAFQKFLEARNLPRSGDVDMVKRRAITGYRNAIFDRKNFPEGMTKKDIGDTRAHFARVYSLQAHISAWQHSLVPDGYDLKAHGLQLEKSQNSANDIKNGQGDLLAGTSEGFIDPPSLPTLKHSNMSAGFIVAASLITSRSIDFDIRTDGQIKWISGIFNKADYFRTARAKGIEALIEDYGAELEGIEFLNADSFPLGVHLAKETSGIGLIYDPAYFGALDEKTGTRKGTSNYTSLTEIQTPQDLLDAIDEYILPAWESGARIVITNEYEEPAAAALRDRGFTVEKAIRAGGNPELVAYNFSTQSGAVNALRSSRQSYVHAVRNLQDQRRAGGSNPADNKTPQPTSAKPAKQSVGEADVPPLGGLFGDQQQGESLRHPKGLGGMGGDSGANVPAASVGEPAAEPNPPAQPEATEADLPPEYLALMRSFNEPDPTVIEKTGMQIAKLRAAIAAGKQAIADSQKNLNSQAANPSELFGEWGASLKDDSVLVGYRGEAEGGNAFGATEGIGLYIAKEKNVASFFGNTRRVSFPMPERPLLIDEDSGKDHLPLLNENDDDLWQDILQAKERPSDSDWIKAHKRAAKKTGLTNKNWGEQIDTYTRALTDELISMGYDSAYVKSGGEEWVVLFTAENQWLKRGTPSKNGEERLYSQATNQPDPLARFSELLNKAYAETARGGPRTVGDWKLSHGMDNELWMASDAYHRETMRKQSEKEWQAVADRVLSTDYDTAVAGLLAKFSAGEHLTPPETKMAERIIARETGKKMTPEQAAKIMLFTVGLRRSRANTARSMSAMRDPHKSPMERWRAWMGETVFQPSKKARKMIDAAPSEASIVARIAGYERQIAEIRKELANAEKAVEIAGIDAVAATEAITALQQTIASLNARIETVKSVPTKEAIAASDAADKLARIEAELAKQGVTLEDLQNGVTKVTLMGSRIVADVAMEYPLAKRLMIAAMQSKQGGELSDIAQKFKIPVAELKSLYFDFTQKLEAEFMARAKRGITPQQLAMTGNLPISSQADEDPKAIEAARQMMRLAGFAPTFDEQEKTSFRRITRKGKKLNGAPKVISIPWSHTPGPGQTLDQMLAEMDAIEKKTGLKWERPTGPGKTKGGRLDLDGDKWERPTGEGKTQDDRLDLGMDKKSEPYQFESGRFDPENLSERLPMMRSLSEAAHGSSWWDYANEIMIANLLSAPQTFLTNATGAFYALYKSVFLRALEAGINKAFQGNSANAASFGEFRPLFDALASNMGRALANAVLAFQTEVPVTENLRFHMQKDALSGQFDEVLGRVPGKPGRVIRIPLRGMMGYDEFLKTLISQSHAATLAHRKGRREGHQGKKLQRFIELELADPKSEIWEQALEEARHQTFQTKLSSFLETSAKRQSGEISKLRQILDFPENAMSAIQSLKSDSGADSGLPSKVATLMMRLIFVFVKTPYNLLKRGAEMTPLSVFVYGPDALGIQKSVDSIPATRAKTSQRKLARLHKDLRAARTSEAKNRILAEIDASKAEYKDAVEQIRKDGNKGKLKVPLDTKRIVHARAILLASAINSLIVALAAEGDDDDDDKFLLLTGSDKTDSQATWGGKSLVRRTAPSYALRIGGPGGLVLSYQRIDPFSTAIATMVDAVSEAKRAARTGEMFRSTEVMSGLMRQFSERASTQSIAAAISYATGDRQMGTKQLAQAVGSRVSPNIVRSTLRNLDPMVRDSDFFAENFMDHLKFAMLPSEDFAPQARLDIEGREMRKDGTFVSRFTIPTQPYRQPDYTGIDTTLRNYELQNPALKVWAPQLPSTREIMKTYGLSPTAAHRLNKARGEIFASTVRDAGLTNLRRPSPSQIDEIKSLHQKALLEAKKRVGIKK